MIEVQDMTQAPADPAPTHSAPFDPGQQHLGTVYAQALLGAAEGAGVTDTILDEFQSFIGVLDRIPKFEAALVSPRVAPEAKGRMLDAAFQARMSRTLLNFLKVVSQHSRLNCLRAMHVATRRLYNELRGRVEVTVRTAERLDAAGIDMVTSRLRAALGAEIELHTQVDPDLIGGIVVRIGDKVFDGSVANRLERLRKSAAASTAVKIREAIARFATTD